MRVSAASGLNELLGGNHRSTVQDSSYPLVYKFQNEMKINDQARVFGFKKIIYTDGYDETWTVDL